MSRDPSEGRCCDGCVARSWLLARLAGHLEHARSEIDEVLGLENEELIAALGGKQRATLRAELARVDIAATRAGNRQAGLESICRCAPEYPHQLACLPSPPAVLHVAGGMQRFLRLVAAEPVAIVGARRPTAYGLEIARSLGRGLGAAGLTVVSGMAMGIDTAAHAGALAASAPTVAVLAGGADRAYHAANRALYRQIERGGAMLSELPAATATWRWAFQARNRIIAVLSAMTIVVEAGERSGALLTAAVARRLHRALGAVPGPVTSSKSVGPNRLLAEGAELITGPQTVLDRLYGTGARAAPRFDRPALGAELQLLLELVSDGSDTAAGLARAGVSADRGLAALAELELAGYLRREPGGRFVVLP